MFRRRQQEPEPEPEIPRVPDDVFVRDSYLAVLGREADPTGLAHYLALLEAGMAREEVLLELAKSAEHKAILAGGLPDPNSLRRPGDPALDDLTRIRPDRYRITHDAIGREMLVFDVESDDDFDWLEDEIRRTGYYEHDGVWTLGIDNDKRVMAEVAAAFHPRRVLEIGCASGAVMAGLLDRGIDAVGVDLSELARSQAPDGVRERIVLGDLLDAPLTGPFDVVLGLDVFEHLNPNRIDAYFGRVESLLAPGGWLLANIPAFGDDPIFGNIHGDFLVDGHDLHRRMQVDERGYPINGHLVWATWQWWQGRIEATGMHRAVEVEAAVQERYGDYWRAHYPARGSLFVFRKGADYGGEATLAEELRRVQSALLDEFARPPVPETPCTDR